MCPALHSPDSYAKSEVIEQEAQFSADIEAGYEDDGREGGVDDLPQLSEALVVVAAAEEAGQRIGLRQREGSLLFV